MNYVIDYSRVILICAIAAGCAYYYQEDLTTAVPQRPSTSALVATGTPQRAFTQTKIFYIGDYYLTAFCMDNRLMWSHESSSNKGCTNRKEKYLQGIAGPFYVVKGPDHE